MDDSNPNVPPADPRDARIAQLERQLEAALKRIAELEEIINKLQRGNKRQVSPFSKGPPKTNPKPPGRKGGDAYGTPPGVPGDARVFAGGSGDRRFAARGLSGLW